MGRIIKTAEDARSIAGIENFIEATIRRVRLITINHYNP